LYQELQVSPPLTVTSAALIADQKNNIWIVGIDPEDFDSRRRRERPRIRTRFSAVVDFMVTVLAL